MKKIQRLLGIGPEISKLTKKTIEPKTFYKVKDNIPLIKNYNDIKKPY
jgi:hypothetical protein